MNKTKNTILKTIFIILLIITITYTSISNSITPKSLKTASKSLVKSGLIYNDDNTYTEIFKTIVKLTNLSEEDVLKMLELDYVDTIVTDIVDSIYEYNLTNDESVKYTKEEIIQIVEDNIDNVVKDINYPLSEQDRTEAINYTKNNTDYILDTIYTTDIGNWKKDNND